jgi:ABC-type transport system involved in multi-copper enzyme maturation permease subunit
MINYLKKLFYDQKKIILGLGFFCFLFQIFFAWIFFEAQIGEIVLSFFNMLPPAFRTLLGVDFGSPQFISQLLAFGYTHPIMLICLMFLPLSIPARYIAGEIELRTFDILLTKPIKRQKIPIAIFSFLFVILLFHLLSMFLGTVAGSYLWKLSINVLDYGLVSLTGLFFFLSLGTLSIAYSSFQAERGKALAKTISIVVFLYFFDTIVKLSKTLEFLIPYSYFQLYQPGKIVTGEYNPLLSITISLVFIICLLLIGVKKIKKRDL